MNDILEQKWKQNKYPFNENVLTLTDCISLDDLLNALNLIFKVLFFEFGSYKLYCIEDWHNHDGFIIKEKATTWEILKNISKDKDILFDSRYDDFEVYNLYYDENFNFLLRYNIEYDNNADEILCWFDIIVNKSLTEQLKNNIKNQTKILNAKKYFDEIYAG